MVKTVLVTGGRGFVGHHVVETLLKTTDYNVISLDRLNFGGVSAGNRIQDVMENLDAKTKSRFRVVYHDLKAELNSQIVKMLGDVNIILHIAAFADVFAAIENPMDAVQDNVVGTVNLLNYARELKSLELFIYVSSNEVFGPAPKGVEYSERDRYNSTNPYGATKAAAEEMCVSFENTYSMPIYIVHTMNVFGERQSSQKYIPRCVRKVRDGEMLTIHSDASKTIPGSRKYIHARDVADGLIFLMTNKFDIPLDYGDAKCPKFNIVGETEIDNLQLAQTIAKVQGKDLKYELTDFHSSRPGHETRYSMSGDFLKGLGWVPKVSVEERLREVVTWYLTNPKWLN